jgi:Tfp pilus assembly protein PilX
MKIQAGRKPKRKTQGSALFLAVLLVLMLSIFSLGVLKSAEGAHLKAVEQKRQTAALSAAEAAYEKAVFRMSQQPDMLTSLASGPFEETLAFAESAGFYKVNLAGFLQSKPIFEINATGNSGVFHKTIRTYVVQAVNGWAMGKCQIPTGAASLGDVNFTTGEIIDMPIEINKQDDSPDVKDIKIQGYPTFTRLVSMGESRRTSTGQDKYISVINCFTGGIVFDQPSIRITDKETVDVKVQRFRDSTDPGFRFTPVAGAPLPNPLPAVHLEFFVQNGKGKIRITNNCTVRGFKQDSDSKTYDFRVKPGTDYSQFERYLIYAYHVRSAVADINGDRFITNVENTYVTQDYGGCSSRPGGQIFVDGNVIIGSGQTITPMTDVVQGQITIVATGNIWIADSLTISDQDNEGQNYPRQADGMPNPDNPNVIGLVAQGVIKVVDPGMSRYTYVDTWPIQPPGFVYVPIGRPDNPANEYDTARNLPDPTVVEASLTVGGGGWGAENVKKLSYGGRKENGGSQDDLVLRGNITEVVRGVVGVIGQDGYLKIYHWDPRLATGILPGNIWLKGKYVPVPGGWTETQYVQGQ